MKYLLDTDVPSAPLRPGPGDGVLRRTRDHRGGVATASVVWHEKLFSCHRLPPPVRQSAIQEYLDEVLRPSSSILPFADGPFAAAARTNDLIVVTSDVADYSGFRDVGVEDWRGA